MSKNWEFGLKLNSSTWYGNFIVRTVLRRMSTSDMKSWNVKRIRARGQKGFKTPKTQ
jgi:hypothetical protein